MKRRIRKFSDTVNESKGRGAAILEIVKKLGFGSLEEIKKEKALLTKLEALIKELPKSADVSEDSADDIEADVKAEAEEKSLEDKAGEKEENKAGRKAEEVAEDVADDVEAMQTAKNEPKNKPDEDGEELVTNDQEVTMETPDSEEDNSDNVEIPKARIMSFEEFIEESETIKKDVSYQDDEEEDEDNALPVAEGDDDEDKDDSVKETFTFADAVDTAGEDVKKNEKGIASALKALKAKSGSDISIMTDTTEDDGLYDAIGGMKTLPIDSSIYDSAYAGKYKGKDVVVFNDGDDLFAYVKEGVGEVITKVEGDEIADEDVNEKNIENDKDWEEYATAVLMKAHPDDFDEEVAKKVIDDLKKKYKDDYGAMIGALS